MSDRFARALAGLAQAVIARARMVVILALLLAAVAIAYTLTNLTINTSTAEMISADVPFRQNAIRYTRAFPAFQDPIAAVIEGDVPERVEAAATRLAAVVRADDEHFRAVDYPAGDPFFARHGLLFLPEPELAALIDQLAQAQPLLAALAADPSLRGLAEFLELALGEGTDGYVALADLLLRMARVVQAASEGRPALLSWRETLSAQDEDGPVREIVLIQPRIDRETLSPASGAIETLAEHALRLGIHPGNGLVLRLTGEAVLDQEELVSVRRGATMAAALTTMAVAALLVLGLRSGRLIAAVLGTLAVGLALTAGAATLLIGQLNLISVTFAVLFVGLGVDFGIHLVLRYREMLEVRGLPAGPIPAAVAGVGGALTLSAVCAALGFVAFVPTDYRGLAELGVISAVGMGIAWLAALTLLPALLHLLRLPGARGPVRAPRPLLEVSRHRRLILVLTLGLALISAVALPRLSFDFNPLNLKDPASPSVAAFQLLAANPETSPYVIDLLAPDPAAAADLAARLRTLPEVGQVVTLRSFVPTQQEEKLEILESAAFFLAPVLEPADPGDMTPAGRRAALQRMQAVTEWAAPEGGAGPVASTTGAALVELTSALEAFQRTDPGEAALADLEDRLLATLPPLLERLRTGLDAGPVTLEDLPASLRSRWQAADGRVRLLVRPAAPITNNEELAAFADAVLAVEPTATGTPVVVREASREVIQAFRTASWIALVAIMAVLIVVLRRPLDVLMVLVPLMLAVLFTAASAVVLGLSLNFANVIVVPLLLGLGVSGAIHVVLRRRQEAGADTGSTPRAVLFSALTTIASFGSLAVSAHVGLASMGLLLTVAILWSLVTTLIVLPAMLDTLARRPAR